MKILNKKYHWIYLALSIIGASLIVWEITIYRRTIIKVEILIGIILLMGLLGFLIDKNNYIRTYQITGIQIYAFIQNIISWGFIFCTLFMAANYYFHSKEVFKVEYEIIDTSSMRGGSKSNRKEQPLVSINHKNQIKELVFSNKYLSTLDEYQTVELEISNGLFGYEVIINKNLKK